MIAGDEAGEGAGAVAFERELVFAGVDDRFDPLPHAAERSVTGVFVASVGPQQLATEGGDEMFEFFAGEWLVCRTASWAHGHGYRHLSLKGHFQLDNLLLFNRKFFPAWQRRFVVYERRLDLPRVGIAALAAEAYLTPPRRRPE